MSEPTDEELLSSIGRNMEHEEAERVDTSELESD